MTIMGACDVSDGDVNNGLRCVECGCTWKSGKERWRAYRVDLPDEDDEPALAFYCVLCSLANFGNPSRRRSTDTQD
jgi:hypothetical protein